VSYFLSILGRSMRSGCVKSLDCTGVETLLGKLVAGQVMEQPSITAAHVALCAMVN